MKTASKNRTNNLNLLVKQYGSQRALGDAVDLPPSYFSQIKNGVRNLGDKAARKIETSLKKPLGWMDQDHNPSPIRHHSITITDKKETTKEIFSSHNFPPVVKIVVDELIKNIDLIDMAAANEVVDFIKFKASQQRNTPPTELAVMSMVERLYQSAILGMSTDRRNQLKFDDKLKIILEIFHEHYGILSTETENQIISVLKQIE